MPVIRRQPRVKFAPARVEQQAQHLLDLERRRERLAQQLKTIEEEQRQAVEALSNKYPGGFLFADKKGYAQSLEFTGYDRRILDQAAARALLERLGKKVPMVTSHVSQWRINPVYEDEE